MLWTLYAYKFENLAEINYFLKNKLVKLSEDKIDNMNIPKPLKKLNLQLKPFWKKEILMPWWFYSMCWDSSILYSQVLWFSSKTCKTQHVVVLTAEIYYSKRIQRKINKWTGTRGKVSRKPDVSLRESFPSGVKQFLIPPAKSYHNPCEVLSIREACQNKGSLSKVLIRVT